MGREIARLDAEGEGAGAASFHGLFAGMSHLESGDVAAADRATDAYRERAKATGQRISAWFLGVHRASKALLEGRFEEVEALAVDALRLGQEAQHPGAGQLFGVQLLALRLSALLRPFAGRLVHTGGAFCGGSVERSLGMLAATASRHDDAVRHFETALAENDRIGATPWVAHTEHDFARTLLARGRADDRVRAIELLHCSARRARALGLAQLLARVEVLLADDAPESPSGREAVLRREGEYWTVAYEGSSARVRDARGLRLIALLLASPGREFSARELAAWPAPLQPPGNTPHVASEAGLRITGDDDASIPDARARAEYRSHLARLEADAEEAERFNDVYRAERAREQIALLTEHIVADARSGRRRRAAASERARLSVTKAIRYAIGKIELVHPVLAGVLAATVKTGNACSYAPDPERPLRWVL